MISLMSVVDWARSYPKCVPVLGVAGLSEEPALSIANTVMQEMLSAPYAWKWNRRLATPFLLNSRQQDYSTTITDLGWLEGVARCAVGSTADPQPIEEMQAVADIAQRSHLGEPRRLAWLPNSLAQCGEWAAAVTFADPTGAKNLPRNPLLQIRDSNGNVQVVTGFGATGSAQPNWATAAGASTTDGAVTWTCMPPDGVCWRVEPLPAWGGVSWEVRPVYQAKPKVLVSLGSSFDPIPDELASVVRQGFLAHCLNHGGDERANAEMALFLARVQLALGASDREAQDFQFVPETRW